MEKSVVTFVLILGFACSCWSLPGFPRGRHGLLRPPPHRDGQKPLEAQWYEQQRLDHFNPDDKRTWRQRYFVNQTYWEPKNGPVFLMLGGEGPASPEWLMVDTEIMLNAVQYHALVIEIEHRYYGESHPTPNTSVANLKWLSSRQALLDIVQFKAFIVQKYGMTKENRWISFGGSYSGALSAWLRLKHPETVVGAVATSGPVQAKYDFYEYLEVVNRSLATSKAGPNCDTVIKSATTELENLINNMSAWTQLEKMFHVDPPLSNFIDAKSLAEELAGNFMGVVQYNNDNTDFEGRSQAIDLDDLCAIMVNTSIGSPLQRYAAVNDLILHEEEEETIDVSFQAEIEFMMSTNWSDPANFGERQWFYQTCTEFAYFQTTDSPHQPFGHLVTLDLSTDVCHKVYNINATAVNQSVYDTNAYYGGRDIPKNVTNIVFPNGSIDPWHALGILSNITEALPAIFIQGTAHCANMYPPRHKDLPGLVEARKAITQFIGEWLKG